LGTAPARNKGWDIENPIISSETRVRNSAGLPNPRKRRVMRNTADQFRLFAEVIEIEITRDFIAADAVLIRPPPGSGWRVLDYSDEKRTTWQRRRAVVLPRLWRRQC